MLQHIFHIIQNIGFLCPLRPATQCIALALVTPLIPTIFYMEFPNCDTKRSLFWRYFSKKKSICFIMQCVILSCNKMSAVKLFHLLWDILIENHLYFPYLTKMVEKSKLFETFSDQNFSVL